MSFLVFILSGVGELETAACSPVTIVALNWGSGKQTNEGNISFDITIIG